LSSRRGPPHDPDDLIAQVLAMGPEFKGPAEDVIFSWLITLPADVDPSVAANQLLDAHNLRTGEPPAGPIGRLWQLLRETAASFGTTPRPPRRRGRRRPQ
jgi:hypothetical protein